MPVRPLLSAGLKKVKKAVPGYPGIKKNKKNAPTTKRLKQDQNISQETQDFKSAS